MVLLMPRLIHFTTLILLSIALLSGVASAHIPIVPDDGTTLATATVIVDPWKSWFFYTELNPSQAHYYTFEATNGERIRFMLNLPIPEGDRGFNPVFILMGPGIVNQGSPPPTLEIPSGAGVMVIEPSVLEAEYEGFTPMSQYMTIDLNMSAPATGTYYIAIYDDALGGRYALVTGYVEAYSILEWLSVPLMVITLLLWSGQNILLILIPMFIPLLVGFLFLYLRHRSAFRMENYLTLLGTVGGLMFLGSSMSFFTQMTIALLQAPYNWTIIATIIFATIPLILCVVVLRIVHREDWMSKRGMLLTLLILSIIAPFVWTGLYIGPIMVFLSGSIPLLKR